MNIQIQVCGLIITFSLYIFYKSCDTLKLYTEKFFRRTMVSSMLCLVLDILSIVFIYYDNIFPKWFITTMCKFYILSLVLTAMYVFLYVLTDPYSEKQHSKYNKILKLITLSEMLIVCILPINIYSEGMIVYTYGPAVLAVYVFVIAYLIAVLVTIAVHYKKFNKRRAFAVGLWMLIYMIAAVLQFLYNELLLVGFSSSLGVLVLFVIMENPEANIERSVGCFNSYALSQYMDNCFMKKTNFCMMEIAFDDINALKESGMSTNQLLLNVVKLLRRNTDGKIFKDNASNIVVISHNLETLNTAGDVVLQQFNTDNDLNDNVKVIITKNNNSFSNLEELSNFYTYIRQTHTQWSNEIIFADEDMIQKFLDKYIIKDKITAALHENRVEVFFQPIYSNEIKHFTSAEALVRIRETDGSLLSPGIFIPVAEANGQIVELGERIFELVCSFIKDNDLDSLGIEYIEINLSVIQCQMTNLAQRLIDITKKYQIDPSKINLEITETGSISARNILLANMNTLIDYGFSFSLDDFGKGESNLMYVVDMPVSIVKLDYDMTKSYFNTKKAKHVLKAVVSMAHELNLKIVAEGIEKNEELKSMQEENIDYIQGYYYSRPLPTNDFISFIQANKLQKT